MWIKTQDGCLVNTDKVSMIGIKSAEENEGFLVFLVVCVFEQNTTKEVFELGRYSNSCDAENELEDIQICLSDPISQSLKSRLYRMRNRSDYNG